jgi:heme-degrading monooxygenase HmoA
MDYSFWLTTRTIKPGTREQFEQSWRPAEFPPGLVGAYVLYAEQGDEVVGISIWDSAEACDGYRGSDIEARRRAAMGPSCSRNGRASRPAASWESQVADRLPARPSRLAAGRKRRQKRNDHRLRGGRGRSNASSEACSVRSLPGVAVQVDLPDLGHGEAGPSDFKTFLSNPQLLGELGVSPP